MNNIEFELVKTQTYNLVPFGRFKVKFSPSEKLLKRKDILSLGKIRFNYDSGMPINGDVDKSVCKFMIKHKTDILTDEYKRCFYTRVGIGFTEISDTKLYNYKEYLKQQGLEDNEEAWENYINN